MNKLLIVGTVAFDSIETPDNKVEKILGGAATHIGISASLFNINSAIVSVVGGDFPSEYIEIFRKRGIDVASLEIKENGKTFFWIGKYAENMNERETIKTEVLVASIRSPLQVTQVAQMGADVATIPPKIIKQMIKHPLTDLGLNSFMEDWKKTGQKFE